VLLLVLHVHGLSRLLSCVIVAGSLAISTFFFNNKLLSRVSVDLGRSDELVSLLDLLLLVFLQTFLTLVGGEFTVRCALREVGGVLAVAASSHGVLASLGAIATGVGRLLLISFKQWSSSLFEFRAIITVDGVFILAVSVLPSTQLLHGGE